jgi:D-amino-acid dehydrogenase
LLDQYADDGLDFEMHQDGLLMAFVEKAMMQHHVADLEIVRQHQLDPQVLSGAEAARQEPALRSSLAGAIYFPHERHLRPDLLVAALAKRCRELGATIREQTALTAVRRDSRVHALLTSNDAVEADQYLLAAGAYCGPLSRLFGAGMPVRPGKGYSIDYAPAPVPLTAAVNLSDAKVAVTPLQGRLRLAGTMEFAGLDAAINQLRVQAIRKAPSRYFVDWDPRLAPAIGPWAGARPMTPDGLPIMGRMPGLENAFIATGHGMLGVTLGPASGRAIARFIGTGVEPAVLGPFDPGRFSTWRDRPLSTHGTGAPSWAPNPAATSPSTDRLPKGDT